MYIWLTLHFYESRGFSRVMVRLSIALSDSALGIWRESSHETNSAQLHTLYSRCATSLSYFIWLVVIKNLAIGALGHWSGCSCGEPPNIYFPEKSRPITEGCATPLCGVESVIGSGRLWHGAGAGGWVLGLTLFAAKGLDSVTCR